MLYSVCVNAAGCLPDSDTYPYNVDGLDTARQAVADECAAHLLNGEYGGDDTETTARYDETLEECGEALERGEDVAVSLDADGIYRLTVKRIRCEYSAAHRLRGEDVAAVEIIACGPLGERGFCADCAALYRRLEDAA